MLVACDFCEGTGGHYLDRTTHHGARLWDDCLLCEGTGTVEAFRSWPMDEAMDLDRHMACINHGLKPCSASGASAHGPGGSAKPAGCGRPLGPISHTQRIN